MDAGRARTGWARATSHLAMIALLGLLATSCAGGASRASGRARARVSRIAATTPSSRPVTTPLSAPAPKETVATAPSTTLAPPLVDRLIGVGAAGQVIAVTASAYGQDTATLTAFQRSPGGWQQVFGPWKANIGTRGFAPPGTKSEGDLRTPSGSYGFGFAFGILGNPGVRLAYQQITGPNIVWDDDPNSPSYNEWVDDRVQNPGASPEPMEQSPAYDEGVVIDYNAARTPGLGSAVFLHESTGGPTAGCVSLPAPELLQVLRWLDPARQPRIIMGTLAAVTS